MTREAVVSITLNKRPNNAGFHYASAQLPRFAQVQPGFNRGSNKDNEKNKKGERRNENDLPRLGTLAYLAKGISSPICVCKKVDWLIGESACGAFPVSAGWFAGLLPSQSCSESCSEFTLSLSLCPPSVLLVGY